MGVFQYKRMPFGLRIAPATLQRALHIVLLGVIWKTCLVCLDDVMGLSPEMAAHVQHVDKVLSLLEAVDVSLKLIKCAFFRDKVYYLGRSIMPGKLAAAISVEAAVHRAAFPCDKTRLKSRVCVTSITGSSHTSPDGPDTSRRC